MMITPNGARYDAIARQIRRLEQRMRQIEQRQERYARLRPGVFFFGLMLTYWAGWTAFLVTLVVLAVETGHYVYWGRILQRYRVWLNIKQTQLARLTLQWDRIPAPIQHTPDETHPFECDLNITGPYSLLHLLDLAVSHEGSAQLRQWLLQTSPDLATTHARQALVRELAPLARFRDKLLWNFALVASAHFDGRKLRQWLHQPTTLSLRRILPVSAGLAALNLSLLAGTLWAGLPAYWLISLALYAGLYFFTLPQLIQRFDAVAGLYGELEKLRALLQYLERSAYGRNEHLKAFCAPFCRVEQLPSRLLRQLTWLMTAAGLRQNPVIGLFLNLLVPWDMVVGTLIMRYQARCQTILPLWVQRWAELEALISLANFAYLHPENTFPEIVTAAEPYARAIFEAVGLGHPLIPAAQNVRNDYVLPHIGAMTLVTGSNMAGKSTFLKTVGVNLCLAYAGSPVQAKSLRVTLLRIFTCMNVHDSITAGLSLFYAEVTRLKALLDTIHADDPTPVLFLIDEIFHGTNSRERLLGSRAYIRHLATQRALGLITTHDLELGQLAKSVPSLTNAHFRDDVHAGQMVFDYRLHPGVCPTTNALRIMRLAGLPVED